MSTDADGGELQVTMEKIPNLKRATLVFLQRGPFNSVMSSLRFLPPASQKENILDAGSITISYSKLQQ